MGSSRSCSYCIQRYGYDQIVLEESTDNVGWSTVDSSVWGSPSTGNWSPSYSAKNGKYYRAWTKDGNGIQVYSNVFRYTFTEISLSLNNPPVTWMFGYQTVGIDQSPDQSSWFSLGATSISGPTSGSWSPDVLPNDGWFIRAYTYNHLSSPVYSSIIKYSSTPTITLNSYSQHAYSNTYSVNVQNSQGGGSLTAQWLDNFGSPPGWSDFSDNLAYSNGSLDFTIGNPYGSSTSNVRFALTENGNTYYSNEMAVSFNSSSTHISLNDIKFPIAAQQQAELYFGNILQEPAYGVLTIEHINGTASGPIAPTDWIVDYSGTGSFVNDGPVEITWDTSLAPGIYTFRATIAMDDYVNPSNILEIDYPSSPKALIYYGTGPLESDITTLFGTYNNGENGIISYEFNSIPSYQQFFVKAVVDQPNIYGTSISIKGVSTEKTSASIQSVITTDGFQGVSAFLTYPFNTVIYEESADGAIWNQVAEATLPYYPFSGSFFTPFIVSKGYYYRVGVENANSEIVYSDSVVAESPSIDWTTIGATTQIPSMKFHMLTNSIYLWEDDTIVDVINIGGSPASGDGQYFSYSMVNDKHYQIRSTDIAGGTVSSSALSTYNVSLNIEDQFSNYIIISTGNIVGQVVVESSPDQITWTTFAVGDVGASLNNQLSITMSIGTELANNGYYYRAYSYDALNNQTYSSPRQYTVLSPVANFDVTSDGIVVDWDNTGDSEYWFHVSMQSDMSNPSITNGAAPPVNVYSALGLQPDTTYYVTVQNRHDDQTPSIVKSFIKVTPPSVSLIGFGDLGNGTSNYAFEIAGGVTSFSGQFSTDGGTSWTGLFFQGGVNNGPFNLFSIPNGAQGSVKFRTTYTVNAVDYVSGVNDLVWS